MTATFINSVPRPVFQLLICTGIINYNLSESNLKVGYFRRDIHRLWQRPVSVNIAARGERFTVESDSVFCEKMWCDAVGHRETQYIYLFTNGTRARRRTFVREMYLSECRHPNNLPVCKWSQHGNLSRPPRHFWHRVKCDGLQEVWRKGLRLKFQQHSRQSQRRCWTSLCSSVFRHLWANSPLENGKPQTIIYLDVFHMFIRQRLFENIWKKGAAL